MIKYLMIGVVAMATLAAPSGCHGDQDGGPSVATRRVCDDIGTANQSGTLTQTATQAEIKLDGAKSGVPDSVRNAIDAYYQHKGTAQQMLTACADAGVPE